jgi:hypothetical protein
MNFADDSVRGLEAMVLMVYILVEYAMFDSARISTCNGQLWGSRNYANAPIDNCRMTMMMAMAIEDCLEEAGIFQGKGYNSPITVRGVSKHSE